MKTIMKKLRINNKKSKTTSIRTKTIYFMNLLLIKIRLLIRISKNSEIIIARKNDIGKDIKTAERSSPCDKATAGIERVASKKLIFFIVYMLIKKINIQKNKTTKLLKSYFIKVEKKKIQKF